jgi:hypothetical protein
MKKKLIIIILITSILFLSGCVQIELYQKIKRNGNIDMSLTFKSNSKFILDSLKKDLEINPLINDKVIYEKTDNSISFKFKNINPLKENLFLETDSKNSMLNKENYNFNKKFKFPYYYFVYEINMSDNESNDIDTIFNNIFTISYSIEVFGKVVETNGEKISKNKVKFNILSNKNDIYYVKFRDFFLFTWFGNLFG